MNILLGTHIALWAINDDPKLPTKARQLILDPKNSIYFSAATIWEIAIKHRLARDDMPLSGAQAYELFLGSSYQELPITSDHAAATENLPMHHSDPFDRILIAQAMVHPMHFITHDSKLSAYGDFVMEV
jgi:PIN domain nuclease of toxin-antitoxin system